MFEDKNVKMGCSFCAELSDLSHLDDFYQNIEADLIVPKRIILESDNFVVMPTIGCLVEGYLLVVSKKHYTCMGDLPSLLTNELNSLVEIVTSKINEKYKKNAVCFEHGGCKGKSGSCVDHAHLHVVPFDTNLTKLIKPYALNDMTISSLHDLQSYAPYLYWQDIDESQHVATGDFFPSQFFRKIIADYYGLGNEWDWHQFHHAENMLKTIKDFS